MNLAALGDGREAGARGEEQCEGEGVRGGVGPLEVEEEEESFPWAVGPSVTSDDGIGDGGGAAGVGEREGGGGMAVVAGGLEDQSMELQSMAKGGDFRGHKHTNRAHV